MFANRIIAAGFSRGIGWFLALLLALSLIAGAVFYLDSSPVWYGYVVGEDRRIYMVNLETGELEWVSREFDQIGDPTNIEINRKESILYIASDRGRWQWEYVPLIAVKLNEQAELAFQSYVDPAAPGLNEHGFRDISAVYRLKLDTNSKLLYAMHLNPDVILRTILDPLTAEIIGKVDISIQKNDEFSSDGSKLVKIFPGIKKSEFDEEISGHITILDTKSGEEISREELDNNQGLYPPWGSSDHHFVYVRSQYPEGILNLNLEVYDRESGKQLASYSLSEVFSLFPNQFHVTHIPESNDVAMTMGNYIVVFDPLTAEIKTKAYVADVKLTEVVVTDKPLIAADR